jgi:DNA-binding MarR family transcriptional regulator
MADVNPIPSALFLRDAELRRGVELLYFAYRDFTKGPDEILVKHGFGRAHHRALHFIARKPGLTVSDLLRFLRITKQSLSRVLSDLQSAGLVEQTVGAADRRQRLLRLTEPGQALEADLFASLKDRMARAYSQTDPQAVAGFWQVLLALVDAPDQAAVDALVRDGASATGRAK